MRKAKKVFFPAGVTLFIIHDPVNTSHVAKSVVSER